MDPKNGMKILLADDGSEHARAAVSLLIDLDLPRQSKISIIRVMTPLQAAEHVTFETALDETKRLLDVTGLEISSELILGYPAEKIIEYAEEYGPDLILLGAKGLRATLGILLGGVAQQVCEYAGCPVMVVRAPYEGLSRILITTDGSESSLTAMDFIGNYPFMKKASVEVIHVLQPPPLPMSVVEPMFMDLTATEPWQISEEEAKRRQVEEEQGQLLLDSCCKRLEAMGIKATGILKRGDAATEVIDHVKIQNTNLIITGSRGLSQFKSWLMGSVSRKLLHYSGRSVLVVRSKL